MYGCVCGVHVVYMRVVCVCAGARLVASGPRVFVSTLHSAGVEGTRATTPSFSVGARDFNSGPQAYEVSTLTH